MLSIEQITEGLRSGLPPTADDVSITLDGRRLDTPEKLRAWLDEINTELAAERQVIAERDIADA